MMSGIKRLAGHPAAYMLLLCFLICMGGVNAAAEEPECLEESDEISAVYVVLENVTVDGGDGARTLTADESYIFDDSVVISISVRKPGDETEEEDTGEEDETEEEEYKEDDGSEDDETEEEEYKEDDGTEEEENAEEDESEAFTGPAVTVYGRASGTDDFAELSSESDLSWEALGEDETLYTTEFTLEKEAGAEKEYYIELAYEDSSGYVLSDGTGTGAVTDGKFTGGVIIIDDLAPVIQVIYNDPYQVTDSSNMTVTDGTVTGECTAYYGIAEGSISVTVSIEERYPVISYADDEYVLEDCSILLDGLETDVSWSCEGDIYSAKFTVTEEGAHSIGISFCDAAGHAAEAAEGLSGDVTDGEYISPVLVLDLTVPTLTYEYLTDPVAEYEDRLYFDEETTLVITICDEHIRCAELLDVLAGMTAVDIQGVSVGETAASETISGIDGYTVAEGILELEIPLATDAEYTIPISFTDLAGNEAGISKVELATVDTAAPADAEISCDEARAVNYLPSGWFFSDAGITLLASGTDAISGIRYIRVTFTDEVGNESVKIRETDPCAGASFEVSLPDEGEDFKGTMLLEVYDWCGNKSSLVRSCVVEPGETHEETASVSVTTVTEPSGSFDGVDYYNTDVTVEIFIEDTFSGIGSMEFAVGNDISEDISFAEAAGYTLGEDPSAGITYSFSETLTLAAASNNENGASVQVQYEDNAGHEGYADQTYNIDITAPVITVEYDLNEPSNGSYYSQARTATVTVRERNFDSSLVDFTITNTDGASPVISSWSSSGSGDDTLNVCTVTFAEDGDYTFTLSCRDKAGNTAGYGQTDSFTIDKTAPELTVSWDNDSFLNEYYYAEGRTAVIEIIEHNFDPDLAEITVTAAGDADSTPFLSGWLHDGDRHAAYLRFYDDGEYTVSVSCTDRAENEAVTYESGLFIIDMTPPELEIVGVADHSANSGAVEPEVRYSDTNLGGLTADVVLTGAMNGEVATEGRLLRASAITRYIMEDFDYTAENDDVYTLKASIYDLAGNQAEVSITFSVNRFGSVYTFDEDTEKLCGEGGTYYTDEARDIIVTETNVDTLEFVSITLNHDGKLRTLTEGEDFETTVTGDEGTWKRYTYTVKKENFTDEGTYILTFYSVDRALNSSDNASRGKTLEFAVDWTAPVILISGVEDDGRYDEAQREITLDISDNICLKSAEVQLGGETYNFSAAQFSKTDGLLTLTVESSDEFQELQVFVWDGAGNVTVSETIRFLVTPDAWIQFYMNKPLFYGSIAAAAVVLCAGVFIKLYRGGHGFFTVL